MAIFSEFLFSNKNIFLFKIGECFKLEGAYGPGVGGSSDIQHLLIMHQALGSNSNTHTHTME
jgi:hypothetical protein